MLGASAKAFDLKELPGRALRFRNSVADNRVREGFKLLVNRQQMIQSSVAGFGEVDADLFGVPRVPYYASDLKRERDEKQQRWEKIFSTDAELEYLIARVFGQGDQILLGSWLHWSYSSLTRSLSISTVSRLRRIR